MIPHFALPSLVMKRVTDQGGRPYKSLSGRGRPSNFPWSVARTGHCEIASPGRRALPAPSPHLARLGCPQHGAEQRAPNGQIKLTSNIPGTNSVTCGS